MTVTDDEIVTAMEKFGGSFTKALAEACYRADDDNFARIKKAFPELWAEYRGLAVLSAKRQNATV